MVWLGREEEADLAALRRILRPGQTFVDCGANVGVWTLTAAMTLGVDGHVHAFEPNPVAFEKLGCNIKMNALDGRVDARNIACGDAEDQRLLACNEEHNNSRLVSSPGNGALMVPVTPLDKVLGNKPVHGVKIDVEGHEIHVLKGAQEMLRCFKPWVCVEFNTLLAGSRRLGDWNVHQFLKALGYSCRRMMDAAAMSPAVDELRDDWEASGYCNLFYSMA
jgi:FkbM family methyltransferase